MEACSPSRGSRRTLGDVRLLAVLSFVALAVGCVPASPTTVASPLPSGSGTVVGPTSPPPPASPSPSPEPLNVAAAIGVIPRSFHYFAVGQGESFRILLFDEDSGNPPLEVLRSGRPPAPAGPDVRSEAFSVSADGRVMFATAGRHGTTIDTQTDTGWIYRPIAWDRSANLAASGLTGNGGGLSFYVTVRINPDNTFTRQQVDTRSRTTFGMLMGSIKASTDAKLVLGVDFDSGDIKWWPLADFTASKSQAGAGKRGALWRPGTHEIGFMGPSDQFWLGDVDKAGSLGLCCTAFSGAPPTSTLRTFRADGTAVVLGVAAGTPFGQADYTLVRLGSDPKSTSGDRVTFQDLGGLGVSVRLR